MSSRRKSSSISSITSLSLETSPRHSFQPLLEPPLPSPNLPSLVPRHGKKQLPPPYRTAFSVLTSLCGLGLLVWFAFVFLQARKPAYDIKHIAPDGKAIDLAASVSLPPEPSPVVATDKNGRFRWTISIPPAPGFPLRPSQYTQICLQSDKTSMHVADSNRGRGAHGHVGPFDYYHVDKNFVDIEEAQRNGLLPGKHARWRSQSKGGQEEQDSMSEDLGTMRGGNSGDVCRRSLTYVMEATDAGFGETLLGLWMSYGLAKKEGRAFFIDDTNWAYGNYTAYFQPAPTPTCLPPPPTHRLPCPHHAQHLVVSTATTSWTFGRAFNERFQTAHRTGALRQKPIFALVRTGFEALFHLNPPDATYVSKRRDELHTLTHDAGGLIIGVHVRHGDRHPWEYQYQKSYIPLEAYLTAANDFIHPSPSPDPASTNLSASAQQSSASKIIVASDDPMVYLSPEFAPALRAQSQMLLASKAALDAAGNTGPQAASAGGKFVEENVGWEGGFFADMFWDLGMPASAHSPQHLQGEHSAHGGGEGEAVPELAMQLRALVAKAYLLDLAVVGLAADRVVCARGGGT
ncbi:MAG: hypothetical protein FRX48_00212 [Lasallia pustulata]|uniref:Uncharacterized protein n=1 Tax=Lasallia pustulata TaxID=136370 RepID=A0A5M8Q2A4_9LECA|nr:MAG: hypothetical protein FRX48_00212 [Lasallia pustulata]